MKITEYVEAMRKKTSELGAFHVAAAGGLVYASVRQFALGGNPTYKMLKGIEAALEKMDVAK